MSFASSLTTAEEILSKARQLSKGVSLAEAGISADWITFYAQIAERVERSRRFGISRYPYEAGPAVNAFQGGFFDHKDWSLRRGLQKQGSMRAVMEYESKYVNAAGYWAAFNEAAIELRQERLNENKMDEAVKFDVWAIIATRYTLRVLSLRSEFYKMASDDPVYAKMVLPVFEKRGEVVAADELENPMGEMESHMATQLMKAVATLTASNATKRAKNRGGNAADDK